MKENTKQLSSEEKQYRKMTEEPVCRLIMKLGLPTTISMLITNVYNMVDTWFVSRLGTSATGAVGIVFGLMAIIQAFGFMFGQGAGTNISRALGAHKKEQARAFSATGFYLALFAGTVVSVFGILNLDGLCRLLGSTETILPYARIYAFYVLLSAPAMATGCVMNNILRYEGYASLAMVGLVSGGVLNMAWGRVFHVWASHGSSWCSLSTMISQYISFGILLYFLLCGKTQSSLSIRYFTKKASVFGSILASGFPSMVRQGLCKYFYDGIECTSGCLWRCGNCCDECCVANFYVYFQCGTRNWSGISTGFVVQLWSKKIYEAAQGVLVYLIFWTG